MERRLTFGDIVAIAAVGAMLGGLVCGIGTVALSFYDNSWADDPHAVLSALLTAGMVGMLLGFIFAWPVGIAFGALCWRVFGEGAVASAIAGGFTGFFLVFAMTGFALPNRIDVLFPMGLFALAGAIVAPLARYQVLYRSAAFTRE